MNEWLYLGAGALLGAVGTLWSLRNRSDRRRIQEQRRSARSRTRGVAPSPWEAAGLKEVLDQTVEGVVVLDDRLQPRLLNASASRMLGIVAADLPTRLPSEEVLAVARIAVERGREASEVLNLWFPMRARIHVKAVPIREGAVVLMQDVTEELLAQQIRREFVAHASHELKSPVAGLQTLGEALRTAIEEDREAATRFAEKIVFEADRLGRLVSDLLDLSRLEEPSNIPNEPTDLSALARREREQIENDASAKRMTVREEISNEVWVLGDEEQLGLMIRNLLENAVRYTPEEGELTIRVSVDAGKAMVSVSDTGIGIPLDAQGRVFERFYRVDKARSRDRGGTGLGLAIVKHVAERHGGHVTLQSELGHGSTFTAILPAQEAAESPITSLAG
jgi:signal transduction histidine kinase